MREFCPPRCPLFSFSLQHSNLRYCRNRNDRRSHVNWLPKNDSNSSFHQLGRLVSVCTSGARIYYDNVYHKYRHPRRDCPLLPRTCFSIFLIGMIRYTPAGKIEGDVEHAIFLYFSPRGEAACVSARRPFKVKLSSMFFQIRSCLPIAVFAVKANPPPRAQYGPIPNRLTLPFGFLFDPGKDR